MNLGRTALVAALLCLASAAHGETAPLARGSGPTLTLQLTPPCPCTPPSTAPC